MSSISISMRPDMIEDIKEIAHRKRTNVSDFLRQLIQERIDAELGREDEFAVIKETK